MTTWPLIQRNKVEDSKVDVPVQQCAESDHEGLATLAKKLLAQWETLEYAYRIPKRIKGVRVAHLPFYAQCSPMLRMTMTGWLSPSSSSMMMASMVEVVSSAMVGGGIS